MKSPLKWLCLVIAVLIAACQSASITPISPTTTPMPAPTPVPARFEAGSCQFPVPADKFDCGVLFVPEDRSEPNGTLIQLPVAIVRSSNPTPAPDPVKSSN